MSKPLWNIPSDSVFSWSVFESTENMSELFASFSEGLVGKLLRWQPWHGWIPTDICRLMAPGKNLTAILLLTAVVGRHAGREGIGQFWAVYRANSSSGQMPVGLEKAEFGRLACGRSHRGERWPSPGSLSRLALVNATPDLSIFICNKVSGSF